MAPIYSPPDLCTLCDALSTPDVHFLYQDAIRSKRILALQIRWNDMGSYLNHVLEVVHEA
jgi:hypothetical protein